jgi:hypothetical protein
LLPSGSVTSSNWPRAVTKVWAEQRAVLPLVVAQPCACGHHHRECGARGLRHEAAQGVRAWPCGGAGAGRRRRPRRLRGGCIGTRQAVAQPLDGARRQRIELGPGALVPHEGGVVRRALRQPRLELDVGLPTQPARPTLSAHQPCGRFLVDRVAGGHVARQFALVAQFVLARRRGLAVVGGGWREAVHGTKAVFM